MSDTHDHHGPDYLAHHFDTPDQQFEAGKLGMWLFLVTEVMMFGGLFCAYALYRANHPDIFAYAHGFLDCVERLDRHLARSAPDEEGDEPTLRISPPEAALSPAASDER